MFEKIWVSVAWLRATLLTLTRLFHKIDSYHYLFKSIYSVLKRLCDAIGFFCKASVWLFLFMCSHFAESALVLWINQAASPIMGITVHLYSACLTHELCYATVCYRNHDVLLQNVFCFWPWECKWPVTCYWGESRGIIFGLEQVDLRCLRSVV